MGRVFVAAAWALLGFAQSANADQWWSALGWSCDAELQQLTMYSIRYDANAEWPEPKNGFFVPQLHFGMSDGVEIPVAVCDFTKERSITVSLLKVNSPRPRDLCGGAAWSSYVVRDAGEVVAVFSQGCSESFVKIDRFELQICKVNVPIACKNRYGGAPLRHTYLGELRIE